jgi:competence protein ComFC
MKKLAFFQFSQAFIFPDFCQHCQKLGPMLCDSCYQLIEFFWQEDFLPLFTKNFEQSYFDQIRIMARFKPPLSSLIKALKYHHHGRAAKFLAQMLYFHVNLNYQIIDIITYVPIHPQKNKKRGYNQSQLIAQELSLWTQKPCLDLLLKTKNTKSQAQITDKKTRLKRLNHSFDISSVNQRALLNQKILLVDDVLTTGATTNSISQILKNNGADSVTVVALASKL